MLAREKLTLYQVRVIATFAIFDVVVVALNGELRAATGAHLGRSDNGSIAGVRYP